MINKKDKFKLPSRFIFLSIFIFFFFISFVSAIPNLNNQKTSNIPNLDITENPLPSIVNYSIIMTNASLFSNISNFSHNLITNDGNIGDINTTQLDNNGGTLTILETWLNTFMSNKYLNLSGTNANQDIYIGTNNFNTTGDIFADGLVLRLNNQSGGVIDMSTRNNQRPIILLGLTTDVDEFRIWNAGDWQIGSTVNNRAVSLVTNSIQRLYVNASDGYVGINTTNPISTLDVNGNLSVNALNISDNIRFTPSGKMSFYNSTGVFKGSIFELANEFGVYNYVGNSLVNYNSNTGEYGYGEDDMVYNPAGNYWDITGSVLYRSAVQFLGTTEFNSGINMIGISNSLFSVADDLGPTNYLIVDTDLSDGFAGIKVADVLPFSNNSYSLGNNTLRWQNGYFQNLTTKNLTVGDIIFSNGIIAREPTSKDVCFYNSTGSEIGCLNADNGFTTKKGMIINTTGTQPSCGVATRGLMWTIQGGIGIADLQQVCVKGTLDTYGWKSISLV